MDAPLPTPRQPCPLEPAPLSGRNRIVQASLDPQHGHFTAFCHERHRLVYRDENTGRLKRKGTVSKNEHLRRLPAQSGDVSLRAG